MVSPAPGVAEILTVPVPHLDPPVPPGAEGKGLTVIVALFVVQGPLLLLKRTRY